jgi:DNA polymerase-3 subunit alpha
MPYSEATEIYRQRILDKVDIDRQEAVIQWFNDELDWLLFHKEHGKDNTIDYLLYLQESEVQVTNACNSAVAYVIKATDCKPTAPVFYTRMASPDLDIDFCKERRGEVIEYVRGKYGADKVAQIGTYAVFKPRGSLRDFARVLGFDRSVGDKLANMIPPDDAGKALSFERVIEAEPDILNTQWPQVVEFAQKAENLNKQAGVHAAGVVISDSEIQAHIPLFRGKGGEITSQFDMNDVEDIGLVKYDFLGLKNLTVIQEAIRLIKKHQGIDIDINAINEHDQEVFTNAFQQGKLDGIFQFETSSGFRDLCIKIHPESIDDLSTITALFRPGPLNTGLTNQYVAGRNGAEVKYPDRKLEPILKSTYGVMCLPAGTTISTEDGTQKIEEIQPGSSILTTDGHKIWTGKVDKVYKSQKRTLRIGLSTKQEIQSSDDHVWLTTDGDCATKDLKCNLSTQLSGQIDRCGSVLYSQWATNSNLIDISDKAYILGLLIGNGEMKPGTKTITCSTEEQAKWISEEISRVFGGEPKYYQNTRAWYAYSKFNTAPRKSPPTNFLDKQYGVGQWISKSHTKTLPTQFRDFNERSRVELLRGIWDADGHYGKNLIYYRSVSHKLLLDIGDLLRSLKIAYRISDNYIYIVDRYAFCSLIAPKLPGKYYKCRIGNSYYPPIARKLLRQLIKSSQLFYKSPSHKKQLQRSLHGSGMYRPQGNNSYVWRIPGFLSVYKEAYRISYLQDTFPVYVEYKAQDLDVLTAEPKLAECYDIQMQDQSFPYFIADGVVSHNCFQEQIMKICTDLAGYTLPEADNMRQIIGKKIREKMEPEREKFVNGCITNGISESIATKLFDDIAGFAKYCLTYETEVLTVEFGPMRIGDIVGNKLECNVYSISNGLITIQPISQWHDNGEQETFEYTLEDGTVIQATKDHKFLTIDGTMLDIDTIYKENHSLYTIHELAEIL